MDAKDRETSVDRFMGGWPGVVTGAIAISWMLLVANEFFPGIGWVFGRWGKLIDLVPGIVAIYMFAFGLLGGDTLVGKGVKTAWIIVIFGMIAVSCMSGGGGSGGCTRATPQYC